MKMIVNKISNFFVSNPYFTGIVYVLILILGDMLTRQTFLKCQTRSFPFIILKYFYFQLYKMLLFNKI